MIDDPKRMVLASRFLAEAKALEDLPYLWGGCANELPDGGGLMWSPQGLVPAPYVGVDCKGVPVVALLRAGGQDLRRTHNTDLLWAELQPVAVPRLCDLVFFAARKPLHSQDVEHVEIIVGPATDGLHGYRTLGAIGGDSTTRTLQIAQAQKAKVTYRASHEQRRRFCGFRRLPLVWDLGEAPR